jgi:hypothetical protein
MQFFIDTANLAEIKEANDRYRKLSIKQQQVNSPNLTRQILQANR